MFSSFINRPVLSIVISVFFVFLGLIALMQLPVTQYPDIAPPSVTITTKYTGANAEVCSKAVVTPIERAVNGVPGMTYMTSVSGNDGTSIIQVYFKVGTDPDIAAVNVQNRVLTVIDELPEEVVKAGVQTEKEVNAMLMYLNVVSEDPAHDELFLYNYTDINILAELKRIDGVGFATIMGSREYSMRVWLKPDRMTVYDVSADDVIQALKRSNVEAAPGSLGESSGKDAQSFLYVLKYRGKYTEVEDYENIIIKSKDNGDFLRVKDIADVEFESQTHNVISKENGRPSAAIMLKQRPGSNASEVIENVKKKMAELQQTSFPPGMKYTVNYDVSRFLDASIHEVIKTLIEAFILVGLVVFLFLQDWRSTLIPILAVPVSLVGTFFFMQMLGFSINLLTLFALVLAIGIVVDNAIVVVEAVHAKMEHLHIGPRQATMESMKEMTGAILAITLVMSAVFIPVAFMEGPAGVFYRQFSITLAIAIVISGINALTLSPALCAILLKQHHHVPDAKKNFLQKFFQGFNNWYDGLSDKYKKVLGLIINRRFVTVASLLGFLFFTYGFMNIVPTGFIPNEDQGTIYASVTTPAGSTLERTELVTDAIQQAAQSLDAVETVSTLTGFSLITEGIGPSFGMVMINLKPWDEREESVGDIIAAVQSKIKNVQDADIQFFPPPAVPGYGNASGFEFRILDKTGTGDLVALQRVTDEFNENLTKRPEIKNAFSSFDASFPQYRLNFDYDAASAKGVTVDNAMATLQTLIGSEYATNFIRYGQMYKVMVQAKPNYRAMPEDIADLYVKNNLGEMVPFSSFITMERVFGPEQITRYNMYSSAMVNGEPGLGFSSGDAIAAIQDEMTKSLPKGYTYDWSGMTKDEIESGGQAVVIFMICLVFVYLLLSAQYESFLLPLTVILSLPTGILGAYAMIWLLGLEMNIYAQIALVMLIGLLGKNGILIVEFAILRQKEGATKFEAAIEGAVSRLRPILMTSFAIIAGLIPLMLANGAGAIGNNTIGAAAVGGMLFGTLFGVLIIPGLYLLFAPKTMKN
jgi:hydrophobic/amphiphilic exporter-1 (mainly G- bacteria), HAE1 family